MIQRVTNTPNLPTDRPVFDFQTSQGLCRVVLEPLTNQVHIDRNTLRVTGWAFMIDSSGTPLLDPKLFSPIASLDAEKNINTSGIGLGTTSLYDAWVRYVAPKGETVSESTLDSSWTTGTGDPQGAAAYGTKYYDTAAGKAWKYAQGLLLQTAQAYATDLEAQLGRDAALSALGF